MECEDIYELEELIEILENIRERLASSLNLPKAILSLAKEIKNLKYKNISN